jgi:hypothetical protein
MYLKILEMLQEIGIFKVYVKSMAYNKINKITI